MTVSDATRFIPSGDEPDAPRLFLLSTRAGGPVWNLFTAIEKRRWSINSTYCPSRIINSPFLIRCSGSAGRKWSYKIFTSIISSMVVNWLNNNTCLNSSRSKRSRSPSTFIVPPFLLDHHLNFDKRMTGKGFIEPHRNSLPRRKRKVVTTAKDGAAAIALEIEKTDISSPKV